MIVIHFGAMNEPSGNRPIKASREIEGARAPVNLERRIRQHVIGPVHGWFAACTPGLEPVLLAQARTIGLADAAAIQGGVTFVGRLGDGHRANLHLRVANRVWMRIGAFSARAPEDVYREAHGLPWEALLPAGIPVRVQATTANSRLFGSGMLGRPLLDAIVRRLRSLGLSVPPLDSDERIVDEDADEIEEGLTRQILLARLDSNRLELSLDSSGQLLHRRGFRISHGGAPLRETLAAGILMAAGYDGSSTLVDAMCGSGTFAVEAASIARGLPPGRARGFMFQRWPSYREPAFNHLRRQTEGEVRARAGHPILSRDNGTPVLDIARRHAKAAGVFGDITFENNDFFQAPAPVGPAGLVVLNPPYGLRLSTGSDDPVAFYRQVGTRLLEVWKGWKCAVVAPSPATANALGLRENGRLQIANGGLRVIVVLARC